MKKRLLAYIAIASLATTAAQAAIPTTLTVGYDSRYLLYGYRLSRHLYHADTYSYVQINDTLSGWFGSWYGYLTDGTYNELDVYGGIDKVLNANFTAGLAYSLFNYLEVPWEGGDNANEFAAHVTFAQGPFSLMVRDQYDTEAEGHIARAVATLQQSICDRFSAKVSAEVGYAFEYYIEGNDWNHALYKLQTPYQACESTVITPFIEYTDPLDAIDSFEEDDVIFGASAAYSF